MQRLPPATASYLQREDSSHDGLPNATGHSCLRDGNLTCICPLRRVAPVFDFFNNLNQFYGVLTEFCTIQNNPTMSAGVG